MVNTGKAPKDDMELKRQVAGRRQGAAQGGLADLLARKRNAWRPGFLEGA